MLAMADSDSTALFRCTGCRYEFNAPEFVTVAAIDCPNCEGEVIANKYE